MLRILSHSLKRVWLADDVGGEHVRVRPYIDARDDPDGDNKLLEYKRGVSAKDYAKAVLKKNAAERNRMPPQEPAKRIAA
jgi:hypothetical protein